MIKFIATSPSFTGEVHIVYGEDCRLLQIDFMPAELSLKQSHLLKSWIPVVYDQGTFLSHFTEAKLEFVQADYEVTFDMFWTRYARKINKDRCIKAWGKMNKADQVKAYFGLMPYLNHLAANTWKSQADPETYLKNKYWTNQWK